jgi:hypothetical protein
MQALLTALLLAAAPAAGAESVAGLYEIRQMEMGGGLELTPDGRFRYALEYGAASEQGEGRWVAKDDQILLTSDPMPKGPSFEAVKDDPAPPGELWVQLAPPGFGDFTTNLEMVVTFKDGRREEIRDDGDGHMPVDARTVITIQPVVPIYGDVTAAIPLSAERGHKLTLRFMPNDIGKVRFDSEQLKREGDKLVLYRYDAKIVFKPVQRAPLK